jgi:hypothetical protein
MTAPQKRQKLKFGSNLQLICDYMSTEQGRELYGVYNQILSGLVKMINNPESWLIG